MAFYGVIVNGVFPVCIDMAEIVAVGGDPAIPSKCVSVMVG